MIPVSVTALVAVAVVAPASGAPEKPIYPPTIGFYGTQHRVVHSRLGRFDSGERSGPPERPYQTWTAQWLRCAPAGARCRAVTAPIPIRPVPVRSPGPASGAFSIVAPKRVVRPGDRGQSLRLRVRVVRWDGVEVVGVSSALRIPRKA